jgi:TolA-binding protein
MRKLLSGLALAALVAATAQAQPGGGNGKGQGGGNAERAERQAERQNRQAERQNQRAERQQERPAQRQVERQQQRQAERQQQRQAERQQQRQAERQQQRQAERQQQRQAERQQERRVGRQQERRVERLSERRDQRAERRDERFERRLEGADRRVQRDGRAFDDRRFAGRGRRVIEGCPPGLAKRNNGCMPPGLARQANADRAAVAAAGGAGLLAATLSPDWFGYEDYGPDYRYYDGYLLRTNGDSVLGYVPLLGGALAPGRPWMQSWQPTAIPAYWTDYYGIRDVDRYRYYDDVIYELEPGHSEIDRIVALLAGDPWSVGSPMPFGYDVYNVPYGYRTQYYDTHDHWYRYADGYVYDIDPATRLVMAVVQLLGGTPTIGQPWLASYQPEPISPYWSDYYGLDAVDRYRYYDDVIYELDPGYGEIDAIIAVTAGDTWTVGDRMPYGYDVYNVPYSYRERYYDTPDHWYRYSDGYIYDIDPTTRLVLAAVQLLA